MRDLVEIVAPQLGEIIKDQDKLYSSCYSENKIISPTSNDRESKDMQNTTQDVDQTLRCTTCIIDQTQLDNDDQDCRIEQSIKLHGGCSKNVVHSHNHHSNQSRNKYSEHPRTTTNKTSNNINLFDIPDFNEHTGEVNWKSNNELDFQRVMAETVRNASEQNPHHTMHTSHSLISGRGFAFGGKV